MGQVSCNQWQVCHNGLRSLTNLAFPNHTEHSGVSASFLSMMNSVHATHSMFSDWSLRFNTQDAQILDAAPSRSYL
jgi:hypothetical protein